MSTPANSENPDEVQHNAAFHQSLHCKRKKSLDKNAIFFENYNLTSLDKYNDLFQVYCMNPEGRFHYRALTRILKTGVQDSHLVKSRSPTGKKVGVPLKKSWSPTNLCIPYIFSILAGSDIIFD